MCCNSKCVCLLWLRTMEIVTNLSVQYNSEQERRKVALSLVLDDANVVRHQIMRKANTHRRLEMNKVEVR